MHCPVCSALVVPTAHGLVAPWIEELAGEPGWRTTQLAACGECGFLGYTHRFTPTELKAMYGGYRGTAYLEARRRWEPWYRGAVNDAARSDAGTVQDRQQFMNTVLRHAHRREFDLAVDIGGDAGQYIPASVRGAKYVVEVSDVTPLEGVRLVSDLESVPGDPDLILICHVLEHDNDPAHMVRQARRSIDSDGVLYVEVPLDAPRPQPWHASDNYRAYLAALRRNRIAFTGQDLITGAARQRGLRIPKLGVIKQSEHLNYFSASSLFTLLTREGFAVQRWHADPNMSMAGLRFGALGMLARPN